MHFAMCSMTGKYLRHGVFTARLSQHPFNWKHSGGHVFVPGNRRQYSLQDGQGDRIDKGKIRPITKLAQFATWLKLASPSQLTLTEGDSDRFNRWKIIPAAVFTHVSLGSVFAWSIFNSPLTHTLGNFLVQL